MPTRRSTSQRGTALIAVLWTSLLVSVILAGVIANVRIDVKSTHARGERLKAETAARSAIDIGAQLLAAGDITSIDELSATTALSFNGYDIQYQPSPESLKLDINLASEGALATLFEFLGMELVEAQRVAARIADWRDADGLSRPNGAEERDYAVSKNGEIIGNRNFYSVTELSQVLEFPETLLDCVRPVTTVFGVSALPDNSLMQEIYGASPFDEQHLGNKTRLGTAGRAANAGSRTGFSVIATSPSGGREELTSLFRITGGRDQPFNMIATYRTAPVSHPVENCTSKSKISK